MTQPPFGKAGTFMKLTLEQIRTITTGAVEIVQEMDGIHFYRFTREQMTFSQPQIKNLEQKRIPFWREIT